MSVVCINVAAKNQKQVVVKGSPEMISSLSKSSSLPQNYASTLEKYTSQGKRVIAFGHKFLEKVSLE